MSFFDKKEEVIEIKLTSYGKYRLSKGEFTPKYYAFFDDDILYNSGFAGGSSEEPYPEKRIQDETPSTRGTTTNIGLDKLVSMTQNKESYDGPDERYDYVVASVTDMDTVSLPIGTSDPANIHAPAWNIKILKGNINFGSFHETNLDPRSTYLIPNISSSIDYSTNIYNQTDVVGATELAERTKAEQAYSETMGTITSPSSNHLVTYFPDGSLITITDGSLIFDFKEDNVEYQNENFTIEVYRIDEETQTDAGGEKQMRIAEMRRPMSFIDHPEKIVNSILLDDDEMIQIDDSLIDDTYVEYFMDISVDNEIDDVSVCNYIATTETDQINWSRVLSCSGIYETPGAELYIDEDLTDCEVG
tara:strand:+ start:1516 stop:2595 length:1080 start_codon:yes stop_codon:yes gene_type:complete